MTKWFDRVIRALPEKWFGRIDVFQRALGEAILRSRPTRKIDPLRHLEVFDPVWWGSRPIVVIGAGATGSKIAHNIAKLGVSKLIIYDDDTVAEHNIANQDFFMGHVGELKVDALREIIMASTGIEVEVHAEKFLPTTQPPGVVVFLLVDSMDVRREIWEGALKFNPAVELVIETRMGPDQGRIYTITNPSDPTQIEEYENTYYSDAKAAVSACGASVTVGPTAELISAYAIWQYIKWAQNLRGDKEFCVVENEILFILRPAVAVFTKVWQAAA